jgi:very-short-patch-repair endonuclease
LASYRGDVHRAQKEFRCGTIRKEGCSTKILKGDVYFCLIEKTGDQFRTYRYCLDCAHTLYPDLVKQASQEIKNASKQKMVGTRFKRAVFAERQSQYMRRRSTPPEQFLWSLLKGKQMGVSFFRQKVLQGYVVDFWCPEAKLAVELDGRHHLSQKDRDAARDAVLREHGITVLRFPAMAVYADAHSIIQIIREVLQRGH